LLLTFAGGRGHADPLVPVARAAVAAGHRVAFSGRPAALPALAAAGFATVPTGTDRGAGPASITPLRPPDPVREERVLRDGFAGTLARERAAAVLDLLAEWRADALVCDETDFGAMVAAECLGIPYAVVIVIAAGGFVRAGVVAPPLASLRAEHGLPPDGGAVPASAALVLAPFPPAFRDPAYPLSPDTVAVRPAALDPGPHAPPPPWLPALGRERPVVAVTLGTVFNVESGDLFTRVLAGTAMLPVDVVAAVGPQIDPAALGPQPANVHVTRFVAWPDLLPRSRVMVSHGGSGSVLGALAHGLPSLLLPLGADQPHNARRCAALGIGRVLDPVDATAEQIRDAVGAVLDDEPTAERARRWAARCRDLPTAGAAVDALARRVSAARPAR
jgi:UDP:flavonoid glycosyltransferase YjiC (YdhE family)